MPFNHNILNNQEKSVESTGYDDLKNVEFNQNTPEDKERPIAEVVETEDAKIITYEDGSIHAEYKDGGILDRNPDGSGIYQYEDSVRFIESYAEIAERNKRYEEHQKMEQEKRDAEFKDRTSPANIFKHELSEKFLSDPHDWAIMPGNEEMVEKAIKEYDNYQRQQNRLVSGLTRGPEGFSRPAEISDDEKNQLLDDINSGRVTREDAKKILENIVGPDRQIGVESLGDRISSNNHEAKILANLLGVKLENGKVSGDQVRAFLNKYPTPVDFDEDKLAFLQMIRDHNSEKKYREYIDDMGNFAKHIYGKKQEYFAQYLDLEVQAEKKNA